MKGHFALEVSPRTVRIYRMEPVPGASYLMPGESLSIPAAIWREMVKLPVEAGATTFFNFTPAQLAAQGVTMEASANQS